MRFVFALMLLICCNAFALDSYRDDMASTTGWTSYVWNGAATAVTWEGASTVRCQVVNAASGNYGGIKRVIPVSGSQLYIKAVVDPDNIGTIAATNHFAISYYTGAYVFPIRWGSDGMTIGGSSEIGSDIVTVGTKDVWEFYIYAQTVASATVAVIKNGVYQGTATSASTASTAEAANTIVVQQRGNSLNNATTYIDSLEVRSWGTFYSENMDNITDWTDTDAGNGDSTQATFGGVSTMSLYVPTYSATSVARRYVNVAASLPSCFILELKMYHSALGTRANIDYALFSIANSTTANYSMLFATDGLFRRTGASTYIEVGTDIVSTGVWTTWRFKICTATNKIWIWKNGVYIDGNLDEGYTTTGLTQGNLTLFQFGYNTSGMRTYIDYAKVFSEDGQLLQTIIE